jgi:DNA-binding transcriptional regulator YiaG
MTLGKAKRQERQARRVEARMILAELELSPKELAPRIHVSWRTIYRWREGATPHERTMEVLRKLAKRKHGKK